MNTIAIELLTRILCETPFGEKVDGAYLYCTTIENQASVFQTARCLPSHSVATREYLLDAEAICYYSGIKQCRKRFNDFGLSDDKIADVPITGTRTIST